jgi:hypothetical protein
MKAKNLVGQKFNKWTVLYRVGNYNNRDAVWRCKCDCGNESDVKSYYLTKNYSRQCITCGHTERGTYEDGGLDEAIFNKLVKFNARKRKIKVDITSEQLYKQFINQEQKCALSGVNITLPKTAVQLYNHDFTASVDRIDSSRHYKLGNVQWVHKDVNKMKCDLSQERFIELCKLINGSIRTD